MRTSTLLAAGLLTGPALAQGPHFTDQSVPRGLEFQHFDSAFAYAMGGGAGWLDLENDGDEDLFAAGSDARHALFKNNGSGQFTDVWVGSGLTLSQLGGTIGVAIADYSGDGFSDIFVTTTGPNQLFRNQGNGTFVNEAMSAGMVEWGWSTSASWADFDLDGDLDLYVGNYVKGLSFPYHYGEANYYYENTSSGGTTTFVEQAAALGIDDSGVFGRDFLLLEFALENNHEVGYSVSKVGEALPRGCHHLTDTASDVTRLRSQDADEFFFVFEFCCSHSRRRR